MSLVLVRDDDANATTDPGRLARTYAPLLDAGQTLCCAVIPRVALDVRAPDGRREAFLHPDAPDAPETRALTADAPLAEWLRAHEGTVDVLVHGLTHARVRDGTELGALGEAEARARLREARRVAAEALGRTPLGFVAPWDALSRAALVAALDAFELVSTGFVDRRRLPLGAWPAHVAERWTGAAALRVGRGWVLRHEGCWLGPGTRPDEVPARLAALTARARVTVLVLHHWHFADDGEPPAVLTALSRALAPHRVVGVREALRALDE